MKTIKQVADELGVSKQRVYRYIRKNCISDVHHDAGVMCFDETVETRIKQGFLENECITDRINEAHHATSNDTVIDTVVIMLQRELEIKNKQIDELNERLAQALTMAEAAQALHAGTIKKQLTDGRADQPEPVEKQGFFSRIFRGSK